MDYGWRMRIRRMLEKGMSLEEIAENLNHEGIPRPPHGSSKWSAKAVRKAFVS
jgi:DNA-binding transcriptional MerR regulator